MMSVLSKILRTITRKPPAEVSWDFVSKVEEFIYKGDLEGGIAQLTQVINDDNKFETLYYKLLKVRLFTELNQLDQANKILEDLNSQIDSENLVLVNSLTIEKGNVIRVGGDFAKSSEIFESAFQSVQELKLYYPEHYKRNIIRIHILQAKIMNKMSNFDTSIIKLNTAIELLDKKGDEFGKAEAYNDLGISYSSINNFEKGLNYLNKSLEIYQQINNKLQSLKIYNNIGMIHMTSSQFDKATESFSQSLKMSRELDIKRYSAVILQNMAIIYYQRGNLTQSLENYNESLELFEELQIPPAIAQVQLNLASIYQIMGDYNTALSLLKKALKTYEENEMKSEIATTVANIANIHSSNGYHKKSLDLLVKSIGIYEEIGDYIKIIHPLLSSIEVSLKLNEIEKAEEFLLKVEHAISQTDNPQGTQMYKFAKALILLESDRVVKQAEAQTLLQEIAEDEIYNLENTVHALLKLGDLLLKELKLSASEEALQEFKNLIDRLDKVTKSSADQSAEFKPTIIQVLMLKSKLALIELEVENAQAILKEALEISNSAGLKELSKSIKAEQDAIQNEMMKYKKMVDTNASLYERLQESQIENYLKKAESILKK